MDENDKTNEKSTINLLAVLFAFIIGLTVGNVDRDGLLGIMDKIIGTTGHSLINRDSTTTVNPHFTDSTATSDRAANEASQPEEDEEKEQAYVTNEDFFTVYRTPTGKKYHFDPFCAGDNRIATDIDEATLLGLTPCKKCADG